MTIYGKLSYDEAGQIIKGAEAEFQQMMILYGEILTKEESEAIKELADQGAALIEGYIESAIGKEANIFFFSSNSKVMSFILEKILQIL